MCGDDRPPCHRDRVVERIGVTARVGSLMTVASNRRTAETASGSGVTTVTDAMPEAPRTAAIVSTSMASDVLPDVPGQQRASRVLAADSFLTAMIADVGRAAHEAPILPADRLEQCDELGWLHDWHRGNRGGDGFGAWGTALAKVLAEAGERRPALDPSRRSRGGNQYQPYQHRLPRRGAIAVECSGDHRLRRGLGWVDDGSARGAVANTRVNLEQWRPSIADGATLVSLAKGIELGTLMRMSQVVTQVTGVDQRQVAVISARISPRRLRSDNRPRQWSRARIPAGPSRCSAPEHRLFPAVHQRRRRGHRSRWSLQERHSPGMRYGGREGSGRKHRRRNNHPGLAEIMRLGIALGAKPETLAGLAGVGDLVATCTSRSPAIGLRGAAGEGRAWTRR